MSTKAADYYVNALGFDFDWGNDDVFYEFSWELRLEQPGDTPLR